MTPVIALVGRTNVGKSTLFNRLTCTRDALVADTPGLTRDRKYGNAKFLGKAFIIIDTGGINSAAKGMAIPVLSQSLRAIEEADIIFFIVDVRTGLMPEDYIITQHLRSRQKNIYLVANKIDGMDINIALGDFYSLGIKEIYPITASHGRGISKLISNIISLYCPLISNNSKTLSKKQNNSEYCFSKEAKRVIDNTEEKTLDSHSLPIKIAIIGRPNVGKSTLINRILAEERVVVYDTPGTTRDSIYIPMERNGYKYILIDTSGVRKRGKITEIVEKFAVIKTLQCIKDANVVLLVIDALEGIADQDLSLVSFILNAGRSLVIAVNKWDNIFPSDRQLVKNALNVRLGFINFANIHFISALYGNGVNNLFTSIHKAYTSATQRMSAALLTRIMKMAEEEHQPPIIRTRRVKMKYAHPGGYNPPIIVIHGNQVTDLPDAYKRYLMNYFRRALHILGTPIRIKFTESDNPYASKKNKLTPTQLRNRNRLMVHLKKCS